jgi:hypothetical protein
MRPCPPAIPRKLVQVTLTLAAICRRDGQRVPQLESLRKVAVLFAQRGSLAAARGVRASPDTMEACRLLVTLRTDMTDGDYLPILEYVAALGRLPGADPVTAEPDRTHAEAGECTAALKSLAQRINTGQAEGAVRAALERARQAGQLLLEAKAQCRHGEWLPWLSANVRLSERTAQGYMRLAVEWERLQANPQRVADLPLRDALALLAEPQPEADVTFGPQDRLKELAGLVGEKPRKRTAE